MNSAKLIVGSMALMMLIGCGKGKEAYEKSFKDSFQKSFVKSCIESASKGGLKEELAKQKCECVGTYLTGKYSSIELTKLSATQTTEAKKIFAEAIDSCK